MTPSSSKPHLKFYVAAIVIGAAAALLLELWQYEWHASQVLLNGVIAVLAVGLSAELTAFRYQPSGTTFSIAFIPFLAGVFLFGPVWAMLLAGGTEFVVDSVVRRKPWVKTVFNTAKEVLAIGLAATVYRWSGGASSFTEFTLVPVAFFAGGLTYFIFNLVAVSFAVSFDEQIPFGASWDRISGGAFLYDLFALPIPPLLTWLYVEYELGGIALLVVPLFIVRHVYATNMQLNQTNKDLLRLMVKQIEARDAYTSGHSQRVAEYARIVAKETGLHGRHVDQIYTAALLHDVGKIYEEFGPLLRKEGKLTPEEKALLQTHPVRSAELVATISSLKGPVEQAVRYHHENYNGTGYPSGLAGDAIPVGARIIMIADTLDAMTTDRPYRKALTFERALEEFQRYSGAQFDPKLVALAGKSGALRRLFSHRVDTSPPPPAIPAVRPLTERARAGV
jgi:HD domain-containing protein/MASE9 protein